MSFRAVERNRFVDLNSNTIHNFRRTVGHPRRPAICFICDLDISSLLIPNRQEEQKVDARKLSPANHIKCLWMEHQPAVIKLSGTSSSEASPLYYSEEVRKPLGQPHIRWYFF